MDWRALKAKAWSLRTGEKYFFKARVTPESSGNDIDKIYGIDGTNQSNQYK